MCWSSYREFSPRTSVDISSHSQQFKVIVKDRLIRTNDTSSALETVNNSLPCKLTFTYLLAMTKLKLKTRLKRTVTLFVVDNVLYSVRVTGCVNLGVVYT